MIKQKRFRRRDVEGMAPIELVLVFPILLVLGGMIMCFEMVLIRSTDLTLAARTASWGRKGAGLANDEPLQIADIQAMSPMLSNGGQLTQGVIHEERRGSMRLALGYVPRSAQFEEHHFVLDDCWTFERLTQYRGHGRLQPDSFMIQFVTNLTGAAGAALKFLPQGLASSSLGGLSAASFGLFSAFTDMASIETGGMTSGQQSANQAKGDIGPKMVEALFKTPLEMANAAKALDWEYWGKLSKGLSRLGQARRTMSTLSNLINN